MAYQAATFHPAALQRCHEQATECRRSATELRAIAKTAAAHKEASCEVASAAGSAVLMLQQALDAVQAAGPADYQSSPQHVLRLDRLAAELAAVIDLAEVRVLVRMQDTLNCVHDVFQWNTSASRMVSNKENITTRCTRLVRQGISRV